MERGAPSWRRPPRGDAENGSRPEAARRGSASPRGCGPLVRRAHSSCAAHDEEMPRVTVTRRQAIAFAVFILAVVAFLYFVLPKLAGVGTDRAPHRARRQVVDSDRGGARAVVLRRLRRAVPRRLRARAESRSAGVESYQITMAGLAATRLFAAAGAGGVALTAWALRRSGMQPRVVACRMVAFMVLLYFHLRSVAADRRGRVGSGLFPGGGSFAITFVPATSQRRSSRSPADRAAPGRRREAPVAAQHAIRARRRGRSRRLSRLVAPIVVAPALAASGVRTAISLVRDATPAAWRARMVGL